MDAITQPLKAFISKYKYVMIVIVAGLFFMLVPVNNEESEKAPDSQVVTPRGMQEALEDILGGIQGVGKVRVLLTEAQGQRTVYVFDQSSSGGGDSVKSDAVIITDADRAQSGMIAQVIPPVYLGAIIVCQGGDQPTVRLAVVEAVCDATGLSADKITVLKMK